MDQVQRGAGRPRLDSQAEDAALLDSWRAAQAEGMTRRAFADHRPMTRDELERVIQRATKRQRKGHPGV